MENQQRQRADPKPCVLVDRDPSRSDHDAHRHEVRPHPEERPGRRLMLYVDAFMSEALAEECARLGVSLEQLASFSVLYYLADCDSGRVARRVPHLCASGSALGKSASCARGGGAGPRARASRSAGNYKKNA
jgi:hypothetical protein